MNAVRFCLAAGGAIAAQAIQAQDAQPVATPANSQAEKVDSGVGEIVVTAQRRVQNLQNVPIAVTVLGGEQVERQRLFALSDVANATPNFTIGANTPNQPALTIRGIGSTVREAGSDRSVVPFVDEIYIGRTGAATFDLFDVEQIEVLRGPQGTLFGRNVSGGAVSITTAKPQDRFDAKMQLTVGNYDRLEGRGMVNVPLTDSLAARFTVSATRRDGFYDNVLLGRDHIQAPRALDGRMQLRYDNGGPTTVLFFVTGDDSKVKGLASKNTQGQASDAGFATALAAYNTSAFPAYTPVAGPFNVENNVLGFSNSRGWRSYLRIEHDLGFGTLTLLPSYLNNRLHEYRDLGGIPLHGTGAQTAGFESTRDELETYDAGSMEARINSNKGGPLNWVVGAYYIKENTDRTQAIFRQVNNAYSAPAFIERSRDQSLAGFGQFSWMITPIVELTAGARYTHDIRRFQLATVDQLTAAERAQITASLGRAPSINPALEIYSGSVERSENALTPKLALRVEPLRNQNIYASWSRGYKSGGFDGNSPDLAGLQIGFRPEKVNSYEVGLKSLLFNHTLRLNVAAFLTDFQNLQLRDRVLLIPGDQTSNIALVINAAKARIKGIEAESEWRPLPDLSLSATLAFLHSEVTEAAPNTSLIVGERLPRAPQSEFSLNGSYTLRSAISGLPTDVEFGANYKRTGKVFNDINEQLAGEQPAYGLLDARIVFTPIKSRWQISLWGKNLTNKIYYIDAQSSGGGNLAAVQWGDPRTYGATLSWHY